MKITKELLLKAVDEACASANVIKYRARLTAEYKPNDRRHCLHEIKIVEEDDCLSFDHIKSFEELVKYFIYHITDHYCYVEYTYGENSWYDRQYREDYCPVGDWIFLKYIEKVKIK